MTPTTTRQTFTHMLRGLRTLFDRRDAFVGFWLFVAATIGAALEMLAVAAVAPLLQLTSGAAGGGMMAETFARLGFTMPELRPFIMFLAGVFVVKNVWLAIMFHVQFRFVFEKERQVSTKLLSGYLHREAEFYTANTTGHLLRNVTNEVHMLFNHVVLPLFVLTTELIIAGGIALLLLWIAAVPGLVAAILVGGASFAFSRVTRASMKRLGVQQQQMLGEMNRWVNSGLGGIEETKLYGVQHYFLSRFDRAVARFTTAYERLMTVNQLPRLFVETVAVLALLVLVVVSTGGAGGQDADVLSKVAVLAAGGLRLIPSVNRIMMSVSRIQYHMPALDVVAMHLEENAHAATTRDARQPACGQQAAPPRIDVEHVSFQYGDTTVLRDVSLTFSAGRTVGLIGESGSGKSTLALLVAGLRRPARGTILFDGRQREELDAPPCVAYVPQDVFIVDDTVRANIAYGIEADAADDEKIWRVLTKVGLERLIREYPGGLDERMGERGSTLSGGQRQRIGLARALYREPSVLILDEFTSALDVETEALVIATVRLVLGGMTCIIITHRETALSLCDEAYRIVHGAPVPLEAVGQH